MHEQNIDDILKQLKDSVNQDESNPKMILEKSTESQEQISEETLKQQLKQQYATEESASAEPEITEYALDQELFQEMMESSSESEMPEYADSEIIDDAESLDFIENLEFQEQPERQEEIEEVVEEVEEITVFTYEEQADIAVVENVQSEAEPHMEQVVLTLLEDKATEAQNEQEKLTEETFDVENILSQAMIPEELVVPEETSAEQEVPEIESVALNEILQDYESELPERERSPSEDAYYDILLSALDDPSAIEEETQKNSVDSNLHDSVLDLMIQLGCEEELDSVSEEAISEEFTVEAEAIDREAKRTERLEAVRNIYRHRHTVALVKLLGLGALSLIVFLYDSLPLFGVEFFGIADYDAYPGAYILLGMQLMLLAGVILWKPMLQGLQKMFSLHPDIYSLVAMTAIATLFYDFAMVFSMSESVPPMFHFLCVLLILVLGVGEYGLLRREMKMFAVCTEDGDQYTLSLDSGAHSVAKILYDGGVFADKSVYVPDKADTSQLSFPRNNQDYGDSGRFLAPMMWSALLLSVSAAIVCVILKMSLELAFLCAMCMLFTVLPLCMLTAILIPTCLSSRRLHKRGIVLTSSAATKQYAKADILVFRDIHLFQKCDSKETGIVFYEQSQAATVMGCLQLLYAQIGGPMMDIFEEIPDEYRFERLRIRRITKNGIEAIVNQQHILLVGDSVFMKRYGLSFLETVEKKGRVCICVSLDGKASAKINAKYTVEPIFEMLTERLAREGIECVVETYDPMVQAAFVASVRTIGMEPIAIVHKNAEDFRNQAKKKRSAPKEAELVTRLSRLKLAEAVIWCKRLVQIRKSNMQITVAFCVIGFLLTGLLLGMGWLGALNQYWLLLFSSITNAVVWLCSWVRFPKKAYFTVEQMQKEIASERKKRQKKLNRLHAKKKGKERKEIHE